MGDEELKAAYSTKFNNNFAACPQPDCPFKVWNPQSVASLGKIIVCPQHGKEYPEAHAYWTKQLADLQKEQLTLVAEAPMTYKGDDDAPESKTPSASIDHSVKKLFENVVDPAYASNKKAFDDEKDKIGDMDNGEAMSFYNDAYNAVTEQAAIKAMPVTSDAEIKAKKTAIKSAHYAMNQKIRDATTVEEMVQALIEVINA